jgi:hypothetical protein
VKLRILREGVTKHEIFTLIGATVTAIGLTATTLAISYLSENGLPEGFVKDRCRIKYIVTGDNTYLCRNEKFIYVIPKDEVKNPYINKPVKVMDDGRFK